MQVIYAGGFNSKKSDTINCLTWVFSKLPAFYQYLNLTYTIQRE